MSTSRTLSLVPPAKPNPCSIEECEEVRYRRDLCVTHYGRWRDHRDPLWIPPTPADRFWAKVDKNGPLPGEDTLAAGLQRCWMWKASHLHGYGQFKNGKSHKAHRFAYELVVGPVPTGLQLDHLCEVTLCVNPTHLEPVTHDENIRRRYRNKP